MWFGRTGKWLESVSQGGSIWIEGSLRGGINHPRKWKRDVKSKGFFGGHNRLVCFILRLDH